MHTRSITQSRHGLIKARRYSFSASFASLNHRMYRLETDQSDKQSEAEAEQHHGSGLSNMSAPATQTTTVSGENEKKHLCVSAGDLV